MIVAMKKIFLIVQRKDACDAVDRLRELGLVHVEHQKLPEGNDISVLQDQIVKIGDVLAYLCSFPSIAQEDLEDAQDVIASTIHAFDRLSGLKEDVIKRQALLQQWRAWGDFQPADIARLREKGFCVKLYKIPETALAQVPQEIVCEVIFTQDKIAHCVLVSHQEIALPFAEVLLPALGLEDMLRLQDLDEKKILELEAKLRQRCAYIKVFEQYRQVKISDLRLQQALAGMGDQESLLYLKGFCPSESFARLQGLARQHRWGLVAEDPEPDDRVPTLVRNAPWVELIKPIFGIMNILPGYQELDISLVFLLFLSLFFGMLIGDAGYGIIILCGTIFFHWKSKRSVQDRKPIYLMYIFSVCVIIWGALTGVFFGQSLVPSLRPLVPWLTETRHIQMFCFLLGALHLSIAHAWRALIKMPSTMALAELGWIGILWFMFFLARTLILNEALPSFAYALLYSGGFLAIFFHQPTTNILKTVGIGLGNLLMSIVNMFTDVVSYIRLAAVGLASVAVADAFNQMALGLGFKTFFSATAAVLILFVGHALNLTLGFMAIMVHGIRLNILEFSSHLKMEWSGVAYDPLCKVKQEKI